ncbi:MAG TPA: type II toxin-antitoxin system RelE/ParE family toxin [Xanthobacteraceae bacterium]|nr:type II toxin-antitoxin system RelE/ParE family toxin [Xanthobacteraceae bacterium]
MPILTQSRRMIDRSKKITARFYATASGARPVREWLLGLSKEDRHIIGRDIQKVEFGWPLGMPYCRPLGRDLWEVRSSLTGGRIARVIFCIVRGEMVLLHGFEKKTQKTQQRDIQLAHRRRQEIEE